jgi:hypothetical protein
MLGQFLSFSGRKSNWQFDFRPFIGYNLCFNHSNKSCEPILDIYIPRAFQWFKDFDNLIGFDPYNCFLKIRESIWTLTPKVGAHLGMWWFIPSLSYIPRSMRCDFWASFPLGVHPCLGREPKARVATTLLYTQETWYIWLIGFKATLTENLDL